MSDQKSQARLVGTLVVLGILYLISQFYFKKADDNSFTMEVTADSAAQQQPVEEELQPASTEPVTVTEELLQGAWKCKSLLINGKSPPASMVNASSLTLDGKTYDTNFAGNGDHGTFEVDLTVVPHQMKINVSEGTNAGTTLLAIFEMPNQSTLRICYATPATTFPTNFEPQDPTGYTTGVYIRQPK